MLEARVVKARPRFTVDVDVSIPSGGACGLFGASGAGKSTVLACIAGVEDPDRGRIEVDGAPMFPPSVPLHRRTIGYLTQEANLFPHLTVAENVTFGLDENRRGIDSEWVEQLRDRLELAALWRERPDSISGGQAQRVAFARMFARKPRLVLLDEPFAGLDRHLVRQLVAAIREWRAASAFTLLVVDHEADVLSRLCDRVLALENGRIVQDGTWERLRAAPPTPMLAQLLAPL